jgi:energy-coupling factor transporter ATP-binding protein EcfA2
VRPDPEQLGHTLGGTQCLQHRLDEPTSALDPAGRAEMLNLVAAMRGRKTVIFSSHILGL